MCLSTVYARYGNEKKEMMTDVAQIEAEDNGFWFIDLFGRKEFIAGDIESINLVDGHYIILQSENPVES